MVQCLQDSNMAATATFKLQELQAAGWSAHLTGLACWEWIILDQLQHIKPSRLVDYNSLHAVGAAGCSRVHLLRITGAQQPSTKADGTPYKAAAWTLQQERCNAITALSGSELCAVHTCRGHMCRCQPVNSNVARGQDVATAVVLVWRCLNIEQQNGSNTLIVLPSAFECASICGVGLQEQVCCPEFAACCCASWTLDQPNGLEYVKLNKKCDV
jgi:hypothetical protein